MYINTYIKRILKYVIVFIFLIIIFNLLLLLSSLFPSSLIEKNVIDSSNTLSEQTNDYILKIGNIEILSDNYTDALIINSAYSIDYKHPVRSYMTMRKNYKKGLTKEFLNDTNGELLAIGYKYYNPVRRVKRFFR